MVRWFDGASAAKLRQIGFFPACVSHGSLSNGGPGVGGPVHLGVGYPSPLSADLKCWAQGLRGSELRRRRTQHCYLALVSTGYQRSQFRARNHPRGSAISSYISSGSGGALPPLPTPTKHPLSTPFFRIAKARISASVDCGARNQRCLHLD
jgi:hypothetical protein